MLERYEIEHELASGARGAVFRARERRTGRAVAIKLTPSDSDDIGSALAASSSAALPRFADRRIVALREHGGQGRLTYVISDLAVGHDLSRYTHAARLLPLPTVLTIVADIADALEHMHRHDHVHGDVKPANVLFDPATRAVTLVDLPLGEADARATPAYLAPERLCGDRASAASDQFALGVALYQLCCGALPFAGRSWPEIAYRVAHEPHTDIRLHAPAVPAQLAGVIDKSLAKNPKRRFLSAAAFARGVSDVLRTL